MVCFVAATAEAADGSWERRRGETDTRCAPRRSDTNQTIPRVLLISTKD